ncbi:MAG: DMT family transporter [Acidobacteriota bacterium]
MRSAKTTKLLDWFLLMVVNFMWATQAPVIKLIGDRLGPVAIAFVPMILSTLMFLPALWYEGRKLGRPFQFRWCDAKHFVAAGLFGFFLLQLTYTLGAQRTSAANAAVITLTIPVLVAVCASVMLGEKMNVVRAAGFALALAGVVMTSLPDLRGASFGGSRYLLGNVLFFGACAGSAFYNTYCKLLIDRKYTELEVLVYTSIVASAASIPLFLWVEPLPAAAIAHMDRGAVWGILELAFIVYGCSQLLFFFILKRLDVTQATLSNYALPFFIGLLAVVVLKESITPLVLLGGVLVFASTLLVTVYESEILARIGRRRATRYPDPI